MPVLNEAALITGALRSAARFRALGAELIVADGDSKKTGTSDVILPSLWHPYAPEHGAQRA